MFKASLLAVSLLVPLAALRRRRQRGRIGVAIQIRRRRRAGGAAGATRLRLAPGRWAWRGNQHVWIAGTWIAARPGYVTPPRWHQRDGQWYYSGGHWARRLGPGRRAERPRHRSRR
jgi:hypothetical protein